MGLSTTPASPYRARVIADGASHYWRLGETTGTTAAAEVGGAPGTISGGVTLGQPGALADGSTSMAFDGTSGKVATVANVPLLTPYTIEVWFKKSGALTFPLVSTRVGYPTRDVICLQIQPTNGFPTLTLNYANDTSPQQIHAAAIGTADGGWHHLVAVVTALNVDLFVDGGFVMPAHPMPTFTGVSYPVEFAHDNFGGFGPGSLQDLAIYPRALTSGEIAAHYALRTAVLPPPIVQAYTWARSGIARSDATRSNYVTAWSTVDLIVRDGAGNIVSRTDITLYIRAGSLQVTQALNDEPDTCSFQIVPTAPEAAVPWIGQELAIAWTPGDVLFYGNALVVQFDRRPMNESPWVSVQCQDAMWRFDARIVTYRFPAQSVTASVLFLVQWFCRENGATTSPYDFRTAYVQPDMPSIPAFDVVNQRPSTVMRTLMAAVQGAFYIDGLDVHAWAGGLSEPNQTNPTPLTNDLPTLKAFRMTHDLTQMRKRVLVEGRRASTLIPYPTMPDSSQSTALGLPLTDATLFAPETGPDARYVARVGTQWVSVNDPQVVTPAGANPPQTRTAAAFTPGATGLTLELMPVLPPPRGWVRVAGQYTRYSGYTGTPTTGTWTLTLPVGLPYGVLTVPIPIGETVEWVDAVMAFDAHGLTWAGPTEGDPAIRAHPTDTPVVTVVEAARSALGEWPGEDNWPRVEGFVQDGRYSYLGAAVRAEADLEAFQWPLVGVEWETDDLNAQPGRQQAINLTGESVIDPLILTRTITRVEITFPLRTLPPRRRCVGGDVKASTFLDVVLTDEG